MTLIDPSNSQTAARIISTLRTFRNRPPEPMPTEQCDLCAAPIGHTHEHILELQSRKLMCACHPCSLLFSSQTATKFRLVPSRAELLDFALDDQEWNSLGVPINLAFFFRTGTSGRMLAVYPSPGGATETELPDDAWLQIVAAHPQLADLSEDVEALLVNRMHDNRECYRVSIDHCYQLVGIVRKHWRGLSGGTEIWKQLANFFDELKSARGGARHA